MPNTREVPFFDYPGLFKEHEAEYMDILQEVLSRGAFILQKDLETFEGSLAAYLGVRHVLGVADGTNALMLGLRAMGIGPGDEVIVPSHTYVASVAAIRYVGARPVLADCGPDHLVDPSSVAAAITLQTKAIMPVHLNGRTAAMDALSGIAQEHGLELIEDAAQAVGSRYRGQAAGSFGAVGTFSFYPAKLLGCFGDGGAVLTNDDEMAERLSLLRDHGRDRDGEVVTWGTNCRLDNIQAALLGFKLKRYDEAIARRRAIASRYQEGLEEVHELILPPPPMADADHFDVYQNYEIEADRRDDLKAYLRERGVGTIVQFGGKAVHQYPLGFYGVHLPYTERLYEHALLLPLHTILTDSDVDHVIEQVRAFYGA